MHDEHVKTAERGREELFKESGLQDMAFLTVAAFVEESLEYVKKF